MDLCVFVQILRQICVNDESHVYTCIYIYIYSTYKYIYLSFVCILHRSRRTNCIHLCVCADIKGHLCQRLTAYTYIYHVCIYIYISFICYIESNMHPCVVQILWQMCVKNGPPLSVGEQLYRLQQLQGNKWVLCVMSQIIHVYCIFSHACACACALHIRGWKIVPFPTMIRFTCE